jgi:hypothetical protein
MRLRETRVMLKRLHACDPMRVGTYGALLFASSGIPVWNQVARSLNSRHNNYSTIGLALRASRGIRGSQGRRVKWFRRLILRDLGLVDVVVPIERNK